MCIGSVENADPGALLLDDVDVMVRLCHANVQTQRAPHTMPHNCKMTEMQIKYNKKIWNTDV